MFTSDLVLNLIVLAQPLILGLALFLLAHQGVLLGSFFSKHSGVRTHPKTLRFFECAAYSRLIGHLRYNLQALSLLAVFVIYDVDLFFFLAEIIAFET
jgi:NADH:ubiquinone oxidoreductase subunit 3 (subunit A)